MSCNINRNKEGKIVSVNTPTGERSKLFDSIHSNIFLADTETSVKIYMNAYSDKVLKEFEGEPELHYKATSGKTYDNLEEVLINEEFGKVSMGFVHPTSKEFTPITEFTTKGSEKNEFLASKVREGLLSAERVLMEDGTTRYQGKGEFVTTQHVTALMTAENLRAESGIGRTKVFKDGTMTIEFARGYSTIVNEDGTTQSIKTENIPEYLKNNNPKNKADLALEYTTKFNNPRDLGNTPKTKTVETDVKGIEKSLFGFLKSLGFSTTTLKKYRKSYKTRFGEDPDIQALADIANKVVAFKEGDITIEDLSEEVAHIAIEAYSDQSSITAALVNVHLTPEYTEFAEYYREKYSPFYEGTELEDHVRKEVLGKTLKREFLTRFDTNNKTEEQRYMTSKLKEIWKGFIDFISSRIKPYHQTTLNKLNTKIADSVLNNITEDFAEDISENENFFYNAMDRGGKEIVDELIASKKYIEELHRKALGTHANTSELEKLVNTRSQLDTLTAINVIVNTAQNQMKVLAANAKDANAAGRLISSTDLSRFNVLKTNLIPSINNIKARLQREDFDDVEKHRVDSIHKSANELVVDLSNVEPLINRDSRSAVKKMLDKVLEQFTLTDEQKEEVRNGINGGTKDLGWLGKMFGLNSHSKNILVQLLQHQIISINANTRIRIARRGNKLLKEIKDGDLIGHQKEILHTDSEGNATHYFLSPRDYDKGVKRQTEQENLLIAKYINKKPEEVAKLRQSVNPSEMIKDDADYLKYKKEMTEWKSINRLKRYTNEYYDKGNERFATAGVSDETIDYIRTKNIGINGRHAKYRNQDGTYDLSNMTNAEKLEDENDFKNHKSTANAYDAAGNLKPGLRRVAISDLTAEEISKLPFEIDTEMIGEITMLEKGQDIDDLSMESRRALDISNLNMLYRSEMKELSKTNNPIENFLKTIEQREAKGEGAFDWVMANSSIGLTADFYDNLGTAKSYDKIAQEYINETLEGVEKSDKQILLDSYISKQRSRKELLKQNRKAGSIIDVDVNNMTEQTREILKSLDTDIAKDKKALNIPYELIEEAGGLEGSESGLNEDYNKMLRASGLSEYDFALEHTPTYNKSNVIDFASEVEDYLNKRRTHIKPHYDKFLGKTIASEEFKTWIGEKRKERGKEGLSDRDFQKVIQEDVLQFMKDEYAKSKVASYFKRFQPVGYSEVIDAMTSGELSMKDVMEKTSEAITKYPALEFIEVTPDYSWQQDINNEEFIEEAYKTDGPIYQPIDINNKFFSFFGIKVEDYLKLETEDISQLTPTMNKKAFKLLILMTEARDEAAEIQGDKNIVNKYLRVQKRMETIEVGLNLGKKGTIGRVKDIFNDIGQSRKDEKEYGEEVDGTGINVKVIPKLYQDIEENAATLTENIIEAAILDLKAAYKYDERSKAETDIKALEYQVSQQRFKPNSLKSRILKRGEVSNYYESVQESVDYYLYGIRESRRMIGTIMGKEVDFTQLFKKVTAYNTKLNLAYNLVADLTSFTTGVFNNAVDAATGDFYHKSATKKATKMIPGLVIKYMAESGKINKNSELNHFMELFGIEGLEERVAESASGRGVRLLGSSYFGMSKLANMPVTPKNMYAIMLDHKFYNGRFMSFNDFSREMRIEDKSMDKTLIEAKWNKMDDTFYNNTKIVDGEGVVYNDKFKEKFENPEQAFTDMVVRLTNKITQVNQSVDSIVSEEDQTGAQRDALMNATLMHRGWFMINLTRKFKGRHFNIATGQIEEGHYKTVLKSLKEIIKTKGGREALKQWRRNTSESELRNLKRLRVDSLGAMILIALTNLMLAGDDDDDTMLENLAQLIVLRTTNEVESAELLGMLVSGKEIYEQPVIQVGMFGNLWKAIYKQEASYAYKNLMLVRRHKQLSDIQNQIDSYLYFNDGTLLGVHEQEFNTDDLSITSAIKNLD